jgi:hypothetical protein
MRRLVLQLKRAALQFLNRVLSWAQSPPGATRRVHSSLFGNEANFKWRAVIASDCIFGVVSFSQLEPTVNRTDVFFSII